jgi:hypothetical protein
MLRNAVSVSKKTEKAKISRVYKHYDIIILRMWQVKFHDSFFFSSSEVISSKITDNIYSTFRDFQC